MTSDSRRRRLLAPALGCALVLAALVSAAGALAAAPAFTLTAIPAPSNFGTGAANTVQVIATNVGGAATDGSPAVVNVDVPVGYEVTGAFFQALPSGGGEVKASPCSISAGTSVTCETTTSIPPGRLIEVEMSVKLSGAPSSTEMQASIAGGGAQLVSLTRSLPAQSTPVPFDIVTGLNAPLFGADGSAASLAGSHPFGQVVDFGFPMIETLGSIGEKLFAASGHPHEIVVNLPRGMVVNPSATARLCTETEFPSCPASSQVGNFNLGSVLGTGEAWLTELSTAELRNVVALAADAVAE